MFSFKQHQTPYFCIHEFSSFIHSLLICTAAENITANYYFFKFPHNSNPSIYTSWSEKLHAYKKQIHPDVFNLLN